MKNSMKKHLLLATTLIMSLSFCFTSFADWEQAGTQWKYKDDTTNVYVTARWIESATEKGLWYYLNEQGIMAVNTLIDNQYYVNELGEWREGSSGGSQKVETPPTNQNQSSGTSFQDLLNDVGNKPLPIDDDLADNIANATYY